MDLLIVLVDNLLKLKKQFKNIKNQDIQIYYRNKVDKTCFQHDVAYGDFKNLAKRAASDKFLRNRAFNIVKNPKYDRYQRGLVSIVYKFFAKNSSGSAVTNETKEINNWLKNYTNQLSKNFKK